MAKAPVRVLVVDDEPRYIQVAKVNLELRGYKVLAAHDGQTALSLVISQEPDLVLLDVRMPGLDGYQVCRRIREFSTVPIIMLTALAEDTDKVKGLDVGADDYVTKPFSIPELLARVRAVLRRVEVSERSGSQPSDVFEGGGLRVELHQQRVYVDGQEVHLTPTEYRLLCELVRHAGRVLTLDYLLEKVWGIGYEGEEHLVRKVIYRLRQKIEPAPGAPQHILTKPGMGYLLDLPT
jgi:two-component system KDP operon response regulator KdpE